MNFFLKSKQWFNYFQVYNYIYYLIGVLGIFDSEVNRQKSEIYLNFFENSFLLSMENKNSKFLQGLFSKINYQEYGFNINL